MTQSIVLTTVRPSTRAIIKRFWTSLGGREDAGLSDSDSLVLSKFCGPTSMLGLHFKVAQDFGLSFLVNNYNAQHMSRTLLLQVSSVNPTSTFEASTILSITMLIEADNRCVVIQPLPILLYLNKGGRWRLKMVGG